MRYDQLKLPLSDSELVMKFHPRLTVLAGLSGPRRNHLIDSVIELSRGGVPGGSVSLIDANGRHETIDITNPIDKTTARRSPGSWRSLLTVTAKDLGLPGACDDPIRVDARAEVDSISEDIAGLNATLEAAKAARRRHDAQIEALRSCEARLAESGSLEDRVRHRRARTLVELERLRTLKATVDAPPGLAARDDRLVAATTQIQGLADEWADVGERLDQLRSENPEIDTSSQLDGSLRGMALARAISRPDEIPESLTAAIAQRDRLLEHRSDAKARLDEATTTSSGTQAVDARVLTLAVLDQESLWLTHRNLLLATEALHAAQRDEEARLLADPDEMSRLVQVDQNASDAAALAERRWLPSMIAATLTAGSAAVLAMLGLWVWLAPFLLVACVGICITGIVIPRTRARRALQRQRNAFDRLEVDDLAQYQARFDEHPESAHWLRAERVITEFQAARQDWQDLVGMITVEEATALEAPVHEWVASHDASRRERLVKRTRQELEQLSIDIKAITARLGEMLEPYGLDPHTEALTSALTDKVAEGRRARRVAALHDAAESEAKIRLRLESELDMLGFENADLTARISAFGRELDAALERNELRREAAGYDDIDAALKRLQAKLAAPLPPTSKPASSNQEADSRQVRELRRRRDALAEATRAFEAPDIAALQRQLDRAQRRLAVVRGSLDDDHDLTAAKPVDRLVETLVRYRPAWPTTDHEPAPAWLDDPFAGTTNALKRQLLDALVEVTDAVQVILLTGDPEVLEWAREARRDGVLDLIAPGASAT